MRSNTPRSLQRALTDGVGRVLVRAAGVLLVSLMSARVFGRFHGGMLN